MIIKALKRALGQRSAPSVLTRSLGENIRHRHAVIGGQLFGPVPAGIERLFYCRDPKTAVWKEGGITAYYQVTKSGIAKTQNGQSSELISEAELDRLLEALRWYRYRVAQDILQVAV